MGLFSKGRPDTSGPVRPYVKSFAGWEAPSTFATVEDSLELQDDFAALFAGYNVDDINGAEFDDWGYLVRDRNNPDDYAAVCVWVQGHFVGYLDHATAGKYVVELNGLDSQELNLVVPCHLWAQRTKSRLANRVTLSLPPVGGVGPVNMFPKKAFTILPPGDEIPLEDYDEHIGPLHPYISTGKTVPVALWMQEDKGGLGAYLDKKTYIGRVPPHAAELIVPLVRTAVAHKLIPIARGMLTGSNIRNDLTIVTGDTHTVGSHWKPTHDGGK